MAQIKRCYISGPMRGYANFNFDAFDNAREIVRAMGYHPVSPSDMDRLLSGFGQYPPDDFAPTLQISKDFIRRDVNLLLEFEPGVDAVYFLPGWMGSTGAAVEYAVAKYIGLTLIYAEP